MLKMVEMVKIKVNEMKSAECARERGGAGAEWGHWGEGWWLPPRSKARP